MHAEGRARGRCSKKQNAPQRQGKMNPGLGRTRLVRLFRELGAQNAAKEALLNLRCRTVTTVSARIHALHKTFQASPAHFSRSRRETCAGARLPLSVAA